MAEGGEGGCDLKPLSHFFKQANTSEMLDSLESIKHEVKAQIDSKGFSSKRWNVLLPKQSHMLQLITFSEHMERFRAQPLNKLRKMTKH